MNAATLLRSEELHCSDVGGETPIHQLLHFKASAPSAMVAQALHRYTPCGHRSQNVSALNSGSVCTGRSHQANPQQHQSKLTLHKAEKASHL